MKYNKLITLFICFCCMYACSVQKRHYRKGFHMEALHSKVEKPQDKFHPKTLIPEVRTDIHSLPKAPNVKHSSIPKSLLPDSCDQLFMLDGREEKIKVIEINSTEIKYKKCDFQDGPTYIVPRADVFMIKYANGTKELFNKLTPLPSQKELEVPQKKTVQLKKTTPVFAIISYVLSLANALAALVILSSLSIVTEIPALALICILLIAAIALILAVQTNKEIKMNTSELKGFGLTIPSIFVSSVVLLIFLILALFVFLI